MMYENERVSVMRHCRMMLEAGLTTGSGGNISMRISESGHICMSPTGIAYVDMQAEDVCVVDAEGSAVEGKMLPSSELPMHQAVYRARQEIHAIVHTHSPYATTFACLQEEIPAVHYLVGFAGTHVPMAPYATYGSDELAENAVSALGSTFNAVLLANHGLLAIGTSLPRAYAAAEEIELVARIAFQARAIGTPVILPREEMLRVIEKFRGYGVQPEPNEN
jgi:L-fuculose-phosphate aldolase